MKVKVSKFMDVSQSVKENPSLINNVPLDQLSDGSILNQVKSYYDELLSSHNGMPPKSSIDLKKLRGCLEYIFLLDTSSQACPNKCPYYYRVVGTELRDVFGGEMSRTCIEEKPFANVSSHMKAMFAKIQKSRVAMLFEGVLVKLNEDSSSHSINVSGQILLLPFSDDGKTVNHIFGMIKY